MFLSSKSRLGHLPFSRTKENFKCVVSNNSKYLENKYSCPHINRVNSQPGCQTCKIYQLKYNFHQCMLEKVVFVVFTVSTPWPFFTTLRLAVVLSSMLPSPPGSCFSTNIRRFFESSYPFHRPSLSPSRLPWLGSPFGTGFRRFGGFSWALHHLRPLRLAPLLCLTALCSSLPPPLKLITFNSSAHF